MRWRVSEREQAWIEYMRSSHHSAAAFASIECAAMKCNQHQTPTTHGARARRAARLHPLMCVMARPHRSSCDCVTLESGSLPFTQQLSVTYGITDLPAGRLLTSKRTGLGDEDRIHAADERARAAAEWSNTEKAVMLRRRAERVAWLLIRRTKLSQARAPRHPQRWRM